MGNQIEDGNYPFGNLAFGSSSTYPLSGAAAAPPPIAPPNASSGTLWAIDPRLQLPYTLEWNVALEDAVGKQQTVSASYIGSTGKRLLQSGLLYAPNPNVTYVDLLTNEGASSYNALQLQFQRRLSRGLQTLASYTWSHSIDNGSAGSLYGNLANYTAPGLNPNVNRGPSDFDIRNAFSMGLTYDIPSPRMNVIANAIVHGWSTENIIEARSAPPVEIYDAHFSSYNSRFGRVRPDLIPGQPLYLYGSQYPGGKAFNPAAFTDPPKGSSSTVCPFGCPARQGDVSRNLLRGFGAAQWDFAIHRDFSLHEPAHLQFRAEMFNVLNHPNFGPPRGGFGASFFGVPTQMLGQSLSGGNVGGGGLSPLYQIGGPRSIQVALKLMF
jgi:hypothetical protein